MYSYAGFTWTWWVCYTIICWRSYAPLYSHIERRFKVQGGLFTVHNSASIDRRVHDTLEDTSWRRRDDHLWVTTRTGHPRLGSR